MDRILMVELGLAVVSVVAIIAFVRPDYLLPLAAAIGFALSAPTVFGEQTGLVGAAIVSATSIAVLLLSRSRDFSSTSLIPVVLLSLAWVWILIRGTILPTSEFNETAATLRFFVPAILFACAISDAEFVDRLRRVLVIAVAGVAVLTTASVLLGLAVGFDSLRLGTLPFGYATLDANQIAFPGAFLYVDGGAGVFPRYLGIGREPGVAALFIAWSFFAVPREWRLRPWIQAVLLVALLATQSTAGIGVFAICWILRATFSGKRLNPVAQVGAVAAGAAIAWAALFSSEFGLIPKSQIEGGTSFSDRQLALGDGLAAATQNPIFTDSTNYNASINLVASIADLGLPWFLLVVAFLGIACARASRSDWQLYAGLVVLANVLFAQPFIYATGIAMLATMLYANAPERSSVESPALVASRLPDLRGASS